MCTAITYKTKSHYFGRNLDLEYSYNESVTVTPRKYRFEFRKAGEIENHYAMIGMAYVVDNYPLYYDATNEAGLSMAGLNFPGNAYYEKCGEGMEVSPFELVPWVLTQCTDVLQARELLKNTSLVAIPYSNELPLTPLHWIISDRNESIVIEPLKEGLKIYDNPIGVLTNNPTFDWHLMNINNYVALTPDEPGRYPEVANSCEDISAWENLKFHRYSRGMGSMGLPGDWSSASRFVRATYVKLNSVSGESEQESVSQFMRVLDSVAMPRGCVHMGEEQYEITVYSSCCNTDTGTYYYKTYDDCRVKAVDMRGENLDGTQLVSYKVKM